MAEVLGWKPRASIVAKCDRKQVLSSWASYCGDMAPAEFEIEFSSLSLWGSLLMALFWNIWLERNKRVFEDYKGVGVEELWDRVKHWAALWASVSVEFRDYNLSSIFRDLLAAVI